MSTWLEIGLRNYEDAKNLSDISSRRSAVSRYYYAAFSVITHELIRRGANKSFYADQETPSHRQIPALIDIYFMHLSDERRANFTKELIALYRNRLEADYHIQTIDYDTVQKSHRSTYNILRNLEVKK